MDTFKCLNCGHQVSGDALGTKNRNHCSACLYSLHLDDIKPGDRLSRCGGLMQPLGLSRKSEGGHKVGELCLVHHCLTCGAISKNRLAGDDDSEMILKIYRQSLTQEAVSGVVLLAKDAEREIITEVFGKPYAEKYFASLA